MAFRVFRGGGGATTGGESDPPDSADQIGPVLDRLDSLAAALEALDGGNGDGETVKTTLSRMERRDIQTFSAIDTFATALKSVSHHLAHLRQSVQSANTQHGAKLDGLTTRLEGIESRLEAGLMNGLELDFSPMAAALDMIGQRLSGLEAKLDGMAQQQAHWPFDADAFATALATIADRLARVESKVDSVAQQPSLEPEATANLLTALVDRMGAMESKVDSGADGTSIAACLLAVDRRLSRIESGLGMDRPLPAPEDIPDLTDVVATDDGSDEEFGDFDPAPLPEPAAEEHPAASGIPPLTDESVPAQAPQSADGRDRVDQLLEQVFKVLAR